MSSTKSKVWQVKQPASQSESAGESSAAAPNGHRGGDVSEGCTMVGKSEGSKGAAEDTGRGKTRGSKGSGKNAARGGKGRVRSVPEDDSAAHSAEHMTADVVFTEVTAKAGLDGENGKHAVEYYIGDGQEQYDIGDRNPKQQPVERSSIKSRGKREGNKGRGKSNANSSGVELSAGDETLNGGSSGSAGRQGDRWRNLEDEKSVSSASKEPKAPSWGPTKSRNPGETGGIDASIEEAEADPRWLGAGEGQHSKMDLRQLRDAKREKLQLLERRTAQNEAEAAKLRLEIQGELEAVSRSQRAQQLASSAANSAKAFASQRAAVLQSEREELQRRIEELQKKAAQRSTIERNWKEELDSMARQQERAVEQVDEIVREEQQLRKATQEQMKRVQKEEAKVKALEVRRSEDKVLAEKLQRQLEEAQVAQQTATISAEQYREKLATIKSSRSQNQHLWEFVTLLFLVLSIALLVQRY